MKRVAVFLDAGYFWVQLGNILSGSFTYRALVDVDYDKLRQKMLDEVASQFGADCPLLRIYWYDGPGTGGTKTSEHRAIDKLDDFKLRLGTRNGGGQQKGVDGLIIADIINLTQQKAITHALLITGDSDITPGVVAAQGMGLRAHLLSLGSAAATSPYLAAEADFKRSWGVAEASIFAKAVAPAKTAVIPPTPVPSAGMPTPVPSAPMPAPGAATPIAAAVMSAPGAVTPGVAAAMSAPGAVTPTPTPAVAMPTSGAAASVPAAPASGAVLHGTTVSAAIAPQVAAAVAETAAGLAPFALAAYAQMQSGPLAAQLAAIAGAKTGAVPLDIDKCLLTVARVSLGRSLLTSETRTLRAEFRKLL